MHVAHMHSLQAVLKPGALRHALPHQQAVRGIAHHALRVGHANPHIGGLHGLAAGQHVLGFGRVEPLGPDHFGTGHHLGLQAALHEAQGQQLAGVFGHHLQRVPRIALDAVLEQFAEPQRQQHRQAHNQRAKHQRNLHAQAVV